MHSVKICTFLNINSWEIHKNIYMYYVANSIVLNFVPARQWHILCSFIVIMKCSNFKSANEISDLFLIGWISACNWTIYNNLVQDVGLLEIAPGWTLIIMQWIYKDFTWITTSESLKNVSWSHACYVKLSSTS